MKDTHVIAIMAAIILSVRVTNVMDAVDTASRLLRDATNRYGSKDNV